MTALTPAFHAPPVVAAKPAIGEHRSVATIVDVVADGHRIPCGVRGTVVAVYGGGQAYAVEIASLPGGPDVVTLRADQIDAIR